MSAAGPRTRRSARRARGGSGTLRLRIALYLGEHEQKLGPGKVSLLEAIDRSGSISAAARELGMAYRHAWELVDGLNHCFAQPVVTAATGGRRGGGAALTDWGRELIRRFERIDATARAALARQLASLEREIAPQRPQRGARRRARS